MAEARLPKVGKDGDSWGEILNKFLKVSHNPKGYTKYKLDYEGARTRKMLTRFSEMVSVKDFGAKGDGKTDDTNAIQSAFDALGGEEKTGYGEEGIILYFPKGYYLVESKEDLIVPMNTFLLGDNVTIDLVEKKDIVFRNSAEHDDHDVNEGRSNDDYWNSMRGGMRGFIIKNGRLFLNNYVLGKFENIRCQVTLFNSYGRWTEANTFTNCHFDALGEGEVAVLVDGNVDLKSSSADCHDTNDTGEYGVCDGSFAYTTFNSCLLSTGSETDPGGVGLELRNGANLYGGNLDWRGWLNKSCTLIKIDSSSILSNFHLTMTLECYNAESDDSYFFDLAKDARLWGCTGSVRFNSTSITSKDEGAYIKECDILVHGHILSNLYNKSYVVYLGNEIPSTIRNHLHCRMPRNYRKATVTYPGQLTGGEQVLCMDKGMALRAYLCKLTLRCSTPPSGNSNGGWVFRSNKSSAPGDIDINGDLNATIKNGEYHTEVISNINLLCAAHTNGQTDNSWQTISLRSSPATGSENNGSGPKDLFVTIEYMEVTG